MMTSAKRSAALAAALLASLCLLTAITFSPTLGGAFLHWDDYSLVVGNPHLNPAALSSLKFFWTHSFVRLYAPLAYSLWTAIAWMAPPGSASAESAATFHQLNLLLWLAGTSAAFFLLRQLIHDSETTAQSRIDHRTRWYAAALGAAVFAVHPLQVEPVAWISGMNNLLATALSVAALSAYVSAARRRSGWIYCVATALLTAALLSKPTAVVTPLIALAIDRLILRRSPRDTAMFVVPWFALALAAALVARHVQPPPTDLGGSMALQVKVALDALNQYLFRVVWPVNLCPDYGRSPTWVASSASWKVAWIAPLVVLLTALVLRRRVAAALLTFLLALLPTLGLTPFEFQNYSTVADRYANLALLGPALLLATAAARWPRVVFAPAIAGIIVLAIVSHRDSENWYDTNSLLTRTLTINPRSLMANRTLSAMLLDTGRPEQAEIFARRAVEFHPESAAAKLNLAAVRRAQGDLAGAIALYQNALAQRPDYASAEADLASALAQQGQLDAALPHAQAAVRIDPNDAPARQTLGTLLGQLNRLPEAIQQLRIALELAPGDGRTRNNLAILLSNAGQSKEAETLLRQSP